MWQKFWQENQIFKVEFKDYDRKYMHFTETKKINGEWPECVGLKELENENSEASLYIFISRDENFPFCSFSVVSFLISDKLQAWENVESNLFSTSHSKNTSSRYLNQRDGWIPHNFRKIGWKKKSKLPRKHMIFCWNVEFMHMIVLTPLAYFPRMFQK